MRKLFITLTLLLTFTSLSIAQNLNTKGDEIIGEYLTDRGGKKSKVRVTKEKLKLRGTILGIGTTLYWQKIK